MILCMLESHIQFDHEALEDGRMGVFSVRALIAFTGQQICQLHSIKLVCLQTLFLRL